ncbi:hypothetical protein J7E18_03925 [Oceanobacillus sp. ISL-73]|nr:hypothetical protein [Oceanobacillus sp. ISL-74]MBT2651012.1 hypothetical protein [Oceanobacillus sp. ISL-73]
MNYPIIYADPPWQYRQSKGQGVAENHYQTMNINDICKLPVDTISNKDSVLFLWTTFPCFRRHYKYVVKYLGNRLLDETICHGWNT